MTQPVKVYSAQVTGLRTQIITVEVDLFKGFHSFNVVGLPDKAVEESRDRVSSAIKSMGFTSPKSKSQKVVVSLAPADVKKEGPAFDVAITMGYLLARNEIRFNPEKKLFLGELSLSGELRPVKGALLMVKKAKEEGFEEIFLPQGNTREAALIKGINVYGAEHISEIISHVNTKRIDDEKKIKLNLPDKKLVRETETQFTYSDVEHRIDFSDIQEQANAKRGLQIAAAGGHNIAFYGPPGTGKTLLARALTSILPPLSFEEVLEVTGIHSLQGRKSDKLLAYPPFRAPHHTSSYVSIIGGGTFPRPGEATLAHRGVLFLDEFPEFDRRVIESLREPLEEGEITIARARGSEVFPAQFILVVAFNPCPCGYAGDPRKECSCTYGSLLKYRRKISGPIIDRIDMWIEVPRISYEKLSHTEKREVSEEERKNIEEIKNEILCARNAQKARTLKHGTPNVLNGKMDIRDLGEMIVLTKEAKEELDRAAKRLDLSGRAYHRCIKLARTIADLKGNQDITKDHVLEAVAYRPKEVLGS